MRRHNSGDDLLRQLEREVLEGKPGAKVRLIREQRRRGFVTSAWKGAGTLARRARELSRWSVWEYEPNRGPAFEVEVEISSGSTTAQFESGAPDVADAVSEQVPTRWTFGSRPVSDMTWIFVRWGGGRRYFRGDGGHRHFEIYDEGDYESGGDVFAVVRFLRPGRLR